MTGINDFVEKNILDPNDKFAITNSKDPVVGPAQNMSVTATTAMQFQDTPNLLKIYSILDYPNKVTADLDTITGVVSTPANFQFTYDPVTPLNPYKVGQTVKVNTFLAAYTGTFLIKSFTASNIMQLTTLAGVDVDYTIDGTFGSIVRLIPLDTGFDLKTDISDVLGLEGIDGTSFSLKSSGTSKNKLTIAVAGKLWLTIINPGIVEIEAELAGVPFSQLFFLQGSYDYQNQLLRLHHSIFDNVGIMGTIEGMSIDLAHLRFKGISTGFVLNDVSIIGDDLEYDIDVGATFMSINNLRINPTPISVSLTNLKPILPAGAFGFNLNPAAPKENTFSITNVAKIRGGGKHFNFNSNTKGEINIVTADVRENILSASGTIDVSPTTLTLPTTANFANGNTVSIYGTISYEGPHIITVLNGTQLTIPVPFKGSQIGVLVQVVPSQVTDLFMTSVHNLINLQRIKIDDGKNINGIHVVTVIDTTHVEIPPSFVENDVDVLKRNIPYQAIREISSIAFVNNILQNITSIIDNDKGGITVAVTTLNAEFLNGRRVTLTETINGGQGATATSNRTADAVTSITVGAAGTGFTSVPIILIGPSPTGDNAEAEAQIGAGGVTTIAMTKEGSGYTVDPPVTILTTDGDYDREDKIFNVVAGVSFDFPLAHTASSTGKVLLQLSQVSSIRHNFPTGAFGLPVLIDKSQNYDAGGIASGVGEDSFNIDLPYKGTDTGVASDASLDGHAINVNVFNVEDEPNSKVLGIIRAKNGTGSKTHATLNQYEDLALDTAVEGADNELARMTDAVTGEIEIRSQKPIKGGQATISAVLSSSLTVDYKFRILKNGSPLLNAPEFTNVALSSNFGIMVSTTFSIDGIFGDKFRIQSARMTGISTTLTPESFVFVIKDK